MSNNCCDYGCNQGKDCPARATPITYLGDEEADDFRYGNVIRDFFAVVGVVAMAAMAAGFLSVYFRGIL